MNGRNVALLGSLILSLLACDNIVYAETCDESCVRDALSTFFESTGGEDWKNSENWLDNNVPVEQWFGISKNIDAVSNEPLYNIFMTSNNLIGTIPFDEWVFPNLAGVNVQNNYGLVGTIPENISSFPSLKRLVLRDTKITGPLPSGLFSLTLLRIADLKSVDLTGSAISPDWGLLTNLKELHLQGTGIIGGIPTELFELRKMEKLNLSNNPNLGGRLPSKIGNMRLLKIANLDRLGLIGSMPSTLFDLPDLEEINLSRNYNLEGTIPDTVNNLSMLKKVNIGFCSLTGSLPAFSGSEMLTSLKIPRNELSGSVPENFLHRSSVSAELVTVDIAANWFTGSIPESLDRFDNFFINLSNNWIEGVPQALCEKEMWMDGLVGQYGCNALLCPIGTYNAIGRQTADAVCEDCANGCYYGELTCKTGPCPTNSPSTITMSPTPGPISSSDKLITSIPSSPQIASPTENKVQTSDPVIASPTESKFQTSAPPIASPTENMIQTSKSPVVDDSTVDDSTVAAPVPAAGVESIGVVLVPHFCTSLALLLLGVSILF